MLHGHNNLRDMHDELTIFASSLKALTALGNADRNQLVTSIIQDLLEWVASNM